MGNRPYELHDGSSSFLWNDEALKRIEFSVGNGHSKVTIGEDTLRSFVEEIGLRAIAAGRFSLLFVLDLFVHVHWRGLETSSVVEEIRALEGGCRSRMKAAEPFKREPLRGLWHQHYHSARFIAKNLLVANKRARFMQRLKEVLAANDPAADDDTIAIELARVATVGAFEERAAAGELTGEWIVFAKHEERNYYLCLAEHDDRAEAILNRIRIGCLPQFPFLAGLPALRG